MRETGRPDFGRVRELLGEALQRTGEARAAFLRDACGDDAALRREIDSLLAHDSTGPLDRLERALGTGPGRTEAAGPELAPGHVVAGRYRIEARLGGGGMGVVFRALDPRLGRPVALKLLPRAFSDHDGARERLLVEARSAAALDHPNLCPIHEIGETEDGRLFLVMPCYAGSTLAERLQEGPLSIAAGVDIALQAARGLAEAHRAGFIHRDIKPGNLMLTPDGVVKVLDFGLALRTGARAGDPAFERAGTVAYMSPEQVRGEELDVRTDVWSAGVVLYEMLATRRPFDGPDRRAVLDGILTADPEPLAAARPGVPPAVSAVAMRAIRRDRNERPGDAGALLEALLEAAGPELAAGDRRRGGARERSALLAQGERRQAVVLHARGTDVPGGLSSTARRAVARHGGVITRVGEDAVTVVFGVPTAHEDDALRAVRGALELRREVKRLAGEAAASWRLRIGLDAGWVEVAPDEYGDDGERSPAGSSGGLVGRFRLAGRSLEVARALSEGAEPGRTLASAEVRRRLRGKVVIQRAEPIRAPGLSEPVPAFLVGPEAQEYGAPGLEPDSGLTPLVGRVEELRVLESELERTLGGEGTFVSVVGEAGVGKSRLLHEFRQRVASSGATLVQARCPSYGSAAYAPFLEAMRDRLGLRPEVGPPDAARVGQAVQALHPDLGEFLPLYLHLLSVAGSEEGLPRHLEGQNLRVAMVQAISALFTLASLSRPSVMLIEDWHWADPASTEALQQLVEMGSAHPLMIVLTCRPGHAVDWGRPARHRPLHLGPLRPEESARVARSVLGADDLAPELADLLHERTGGNPFFLEEVSRGLLEADAVRVEGGRAVPWGSLAGLRLPDTVQGVISTRIDRLGPAARETLVCASVIGRRFDRPLLERVVPGDEDLDRSLARLRDAGLIQQVRVVPAPVFRFRHVLTEEVAYDSLLESRRRELHGRVGRALESLHADRLDDHLDRLVHHFSRAEAWREAVRYGLDACRRAASLSQFSEALELGDRVLGWIDELPAGETEARRIDLLFRQERLSETLGLRDRQRALVEELVRRLERRGPEHLLVEALVRRGDLHTLVREFEEGEAVLREALRIARSTDDVAGVRHALRSLGLLHWHAGRDDEAVACGREALSLDEARGDTEEVITDLSNLGIVLRGMGRLEQAREHLERALELAELAGGSSGFPSEFTHILHNLANVHRDSGRDDLALECLERGMELYRGQRVPIKDSYGLTAIGNILLRRGRVEESLERYRKALEECRRARNAIGHAQSARILSQVLVGLGRSAEAIPYLREAAEVFRRLEDAPSRMLMLRRLARAHEDLGHRAEAVATWSDLRRLCEARSDASGVLQALEGLARSFRSSDPDLARRYYEEGLDLARSGGNRAREASLLNGLGILEWKRGEPGRALQAYEASLPLLRERGDERRVGLALNSIAACLRDLDRPGEALARLAEAFVVHERTGDRRLAGHARAVLGDVHRQLGHPAEAERAYRASLEIRREVGDVGGEAWMLVRLAQLRSAAGSPEEARDLARRARTLRTGDGDPDLDAALDALSGDGTGERPSD